MVPHNITILYFAQGALVGGGIAPASDTLSALRRGNTVVEGRPLEVARVVAVGNAPAFVAPADLLAHGAVVPEPGFGTPVATVPPLLLGALVALFTQGAAVPTPGFGMLVGLFAHGAFMPS